MVGTGHRFAPMAAGAAAAAVFAAFAVPRLGRSYTYDESVTVGFFVRQDSWWEAITSQHGFNNHPLLTAIDWWVNRLGGDTEAWLRAAAVLAGAATVLLLVRWSYRRWGAPAAIAAGALTVANPMLVDLSTQARGYSLSAAFALASTVVLVEHRNRLGEPRITLGYAVLVGLGLLAHLYVALVVIAHGVDAASRHRDDAGAWLRAAVLGGLLAAPVYAAMLPMMLESTRAGEGAFVADFPIDAAAAIFGGLVPGLLGLGLLAALTWTTPAARAPVVVVAVVLNVLWLVVRPLNFFPRFLITATVLTAVLAACAAARDRRWLVPVAVVALAGLPSTVDLLDEEDDLRLVARTATDIQDQGHSVCVAGYYWEAYIAYRPLPPEDTAPGCEVVITRIADVEATDRTAAIPGTERTCLAGDAGILRDLDFEPGSCRP